ncbi:site-2 protease family protein [Candidatus Margulisiibacteriota bacterium]
MRKSIHIGTILGIPIDINYTWFIIFGLVTWTLASAAFPYSAPGQPAILYWASAFITALIFFSCLLLHELSHAYIALKNNLPIKGITLFIFGGIAHMGEEPSNPKTEFKMAIAGPITSFTLSAIFWILFALFNSMGVHRIILTATFYLAYINLAIVIFNMIPGFPLDGGRVLRSVLWSHFNDIKKATRIASGFGRGFAFFLMGVGFFYLFLGALLQGIWLIFIGLFLQEAAESSYQHVLLQKALTGTKVKDIMTKTVITVNEDMPLDLVIDNYFFKFRFTSFPVISPTESLSGLITLHDVKEIPKEKWNTKYVRDVMLPLNSDLVIAPNSEIMEALTQMVRNKVGRLIVVEDHNLIGFISQRDVMRLFEVRSDLAK